MKVLLSLWAAAAVLSAMADSVFPLEKLDVSKMTSGWGTPRVGRSLDGHALRSGGEAFAHGVGTHAPSEFTLWLGGKAKRFSAKVGIDDESGSGKGLVKFRVIGDGRVLFESAEMKGGDAPQSVSVDLSGVKVVELVVDDCGSFDCDHADWLDAAFVMKDGSPAPRPYSGEKPAVKSVCGDFATWSPVPPMGWNSWDCYGSSINEEQFKANADYLAANLLKFGYEYAVVDIRWTVQNEDPHGYNQKDPVYTLDAWGRCIPAPNRFPSSRGGRGFKPLADYVHAKGLKFGIHIMRGICKDAVARKLPVKGAPGITCDMISDGIIACPWLRDNYGVKRVRVGAQEYYDSLFELYASWGVDFVKCDDLSAPYHRDEIEMIRTAIDRCGRKIVLSTSPGETPLASSAHLQENANMWRMVNDVWDTWGHIEHLVPIACAWLGENAREGTWPDCDMIPLGRLGVSGHWWSPADGKGRKTRLTSDEQRTLMNLFAICRSPLIIGADLPQLKDDSETFALLTDWTILSANRRGRHPRVLLCTKDACAIESDDVRGGRFLALFNLSDVSREVAASGVKRMLPPHGSALLRLKH